MENNVLKKTKCFFSLNKERMWLEQMAREGFKLTNITMGMRYTFESINPTTLVYEIDRFNLSKNPTLREIKEKQNFMSMATEMGWEIATYDEDLNYYFCKEYDENEVNELYNDPEARQLHANKYREHYKNVSTAILLKILLWVNIISLIFNLLLKNEGESFFWFNIFTLVYTAITIIIVLAFNNLGDKYYMELLKAREEIITINGSSKEYKKVIKIFCRGNSLIRYLNEQSRLGWSLVSMTKFTYIFKKEEGQLYYYTIDSKGLTNKRLKKSGKDKCIDHKDWQEMNNDWQVESVRESEGVNLEFVCALRNQLLVFRSQQKDFQPLNSGSKQPLVGIFSNRYSIVYILCFLGGGVAGACLSMLQF